MRKRTTLADLLAANAKANTPAFLKALFPDLELDEAGATKGCTCPACQQKRATHAQQQHAAKNQQEAAPASGVENMLVQTVAALVVNNQIISVGHTVAEKDNDELQVVFRMAEDEEAYALTADQARILGHALLAAANEID